MDPTLEPEDFIPELEATAELGARHIIAQLPDPDRERATARFARLCDLAKPLGIFVSLEFPHWTETGNLAEAAQVVRAVEPQQCRHPGRHAALRPLGFEPRASSPQLPREWFRFAHVCDAAKEVPPTMAGIIRTARDERQFPGEGGIDVRGILARMPQDIPYALEIPRVALTKAVGPEEVARLALRVARSHLDGVEKGFGRRDRGAQSTQRGIDAQRLMQHREALNIVLQGRSCQDAAASWRQMF